MNSTDIKNMIDDYANRKVADAVKETCDQHKRLNEMFNALSISSSEYDAEIKRLRGIIMTCPACSRQMKIAAVERQDFADTDYWREHEAHARGEIDANDNA